MMSAKSKDAQAYTACLEYLNKQNRPYSAVDVFNNLHKEYGKTVITKVLDSLSQDGKIRSKVYGKQMVYVADQKQYAEVPDSELKGMDSTIQQHTDQVRRETDRFRKLDTQLRGLNNAITTEAALERLSAVSEQQTKLQEKLQTLQKNKDAVSPAERQQIMASRTTYVKGWRKRKRIASDILGAILEGYPKTKKQLYEDIGIETDEEYKVKPPED